MIDMELKKQQHAKTQNGYTQALRLEGSIFSTFDQTHLIARLDPGVRHLCSPHHVDGLRAD